MKTVEETIEAILLVARRQRDNAGDRTHQSVRNFNDGRISAYEHCLEIIAENRREQGKQRARCSE
jgi:hypothetical protein